MKYILAIAIIFIIISCDKKDISLKLLDNINGEKFENNYLKYVSYLNNDTKFKQTISFYPNGTLNQFGLYNESNKSGRFFEYFPTGIPKIKKEYQNDTLTGFLLSFYPNGIVKRYSYYENGKQYYFREYDSLGIKIKEAGYIMPRAIYDDNISSVKFCFMLPPYCKNEVVIRNYSGNKLIKEETLKNIQQFKWKILDKDSERFEVILKLSDSYLKDSIINKYRFSVLDIISFK